MKTTLTRKQFLLGASAGALGLSSRRARAARAQVIKLGLDVPSDHPATKSAVAAGERIESESKGRVKVQVFPSNQLGNDEHMLSEVRSGAIQMMGIGDNILASLVPSTAVDNLGFAFKTVQAAWDALDGKVGEIVTADIQKIGLYPMRRIWDEGFRNITTSTKPINHPGDLKGFKIRVPPSPISVSLFSKLGSAATSLNSSEIYTALQTKVVEGQENPLGVIETQKFYQVQKYCSMTNHMWVGYWMIMNGAFWKSLDPADQKIVAAAFDEEAPNQRTANDKLNNSLEGTLTSQGLTFNKTDPAEFQKALVDAGFYSEWKPKFSPELWAALEHYSGKLA